MFIKEITIGKAFKLSKNYNSTDASVFMTASLTEKDDPEEVYDELSGLVSDNLAIEIKEQTKKLAEIAREGKY